MDKSEHEAEARERKKNPDGPGGMGEQRPKDATSPTDHDYAEYMRYLRTPRRLLFMNFLAGLARGLGMSVGFTILGALLIYFLRQLVWQNIPWLSQFIAEIVVLVDAKT